MSKEIIRSIKEAERQAGVIRAEAEMSAKERIRVATADGEALVALTEKTAKERNGEKLTLTRTKAEELLAATEIEANAEREALREQSAERIKDAVRDVIGGLFESCQ